MNEKEAMKILIDAVKSAIKHPQRTLPEENVLGKIGKMIVEVSIEDILFNMQNDLEINVDLIQDFYVLVGERWEILQGYSLKDIEIKSK